MKRYFILIVAGIAALALQSCKDETKEWTERVPLFKVEGPEGEGSDIWLSGRPQSVNFTVYATDSWSAEVTGCDRYGLSTSVGGAGKTVVSLDAPENEDGEIREAVVSFYFLDELKAQYNITQEIQEPYIEVENNDITVLGFGQTFTIDIKTNQSEWKISETTPVPAWLTLDSQTSTSLTFTAPENKSGASRSCDLLIQVVGKETELFCEIKITQGEPATVPTDLILDVEFSATGATDLSSSKLTVKTDRLSGDCETKVVSQFGGRVAACFKNAEIGRGNLDNGYYYIPYTTDSDFAKKLADGFSYELVFCTYYNPLENTKQVKPFASTNAGGIGVCLQAGTGRIHFETHIGGGWKSPLSSVVPVPNVYYHVVGTWDKTNATATIYVNGKKEASLNASGDLKFPALNAGVEQWFGIGADPNAAGKGEASFHGEVVVARLYDAPMSEAEAMACYYELTK